MIDFSKVSTNPLNPIHATLRTYIWKELHYALRTPTITSIVLYGGGNDNGRNFSAGADITEFAMLTTNTSSSSSFVIPVVPSLVDIINVMDTSTKPIVACIAGICYGGGMELVLACHYRIAAATTTTTTSSLQSTNTSTRPISTKFALPEIHVGVIPGAGGTQRLPRIIGLQKSLQYILSGQSISVSQAYAMKLIDAIVVVDVVPVVVDPMTNGKGTATATTTTSATTTTQPSLLEVGIQWAHYAELLPLETLRISARTTLPDVTSSPAQAHIICHLASLSIPNMTQSHIAIIEACRASCTSRTFQEGMKRESELFLQVLNSVEGKARRHAFFAVRSAQKPMVAKQEVGLSPRCQHPLLMDPKTSTTKIEVAVIGAGTMGSGIAMTFLLAGYKVYLVDNSEDALQKGVTMIQQVLNTYVTKQKISSNIKDILLSKQQFVPTKNMQELRNCVLVVEAIIENMSIKQTIFRQLNAILNDSHNEHCIVTSNTSTLDIAQMASVMDHSHRQSQFAGLHFFSPAYLMQLVEIIHCNNNHNHSNTTNGTSTTPTTTTSPQTIAILQSVTKRIGKIGVVVGNCDGFCGNRMLRPYSAETVLLLVESEDRLQIPPTIEQVDYAIRNVFGMALGPFEMSDLAGNDIGYNIRKERGWVRLDNHPNSNDTTTPPPVRRPSRYTELADDMVSQLHRYGQKASKGWYDYDRNIGKGRKPLPSIEMKNFIQKYIGQHSQQQHRHHLSSMSSDTNKDCMSDQEIIERVLYPLVNEGFKCLEEQIVSQPSDIDVIYIYGYGFPITKGGPMYWADHIVTLPILLSKLQEMYQKYPTTEHYQPSQLLMDCVRHHMTLNDYWRTKMMKKKNERHSNL